MVTLRFLTFVELISFASMFFAAYKNDCLNIAFASVLIAMLTVGISLSGKEYLQNVLPHCIGKIGSFSVPIFCLHRPIFGTVRYFFGDLPDEKKLLVGVGLTLIISFVLKLFVDFLNPKSKARF